MKKMYLKNSIYTMLLCLLVATGINKVKAQTYSTFATGITQPVGMCFDNSGNLVVGSFTGYAYWYKVNSSGVVSSFSQTTRPYSIANDGKDNFYTNDLQNMFEINSSGVIIPSPSSTQYLHLYSGGGGTGYFIGIAVDNSSNIYTLRANVGIIQKVPPVSSIILSPSVYQFCTTLTKITNPTQSNGALAFDAAGNLYAGYANLLYRVTPAGVSTLVCTLPSPVTALNGITSLVIDKSGNIILAGFFSGIYNVTPSGTVTTYSSLSGLSNIRGLAIDNSGNLYASDYSNNQILKISFCTPTTATVTASACGSYTWHGTTYTASTSTATFDSLNAAGCDSLTTLNLTINQPTTATVTASACGSYTWHGTTYNASTSTATFDTTNAAGCDSLTTLHLTITANTTPAVSISPTSTNSANQTFTATASNTGGGTVLYTFVKGISSQLSSASNTWNATGLANGDVISCGITVTGGTCLTTTTAVSNQASVCVTGVTPALGILPTTATNASTTFTANVINSGGGIVTYNFKKNNISQVSSTSNTWNATGLVTGDVITCSISISGGSCLTQTTANSTNSVTACVNPAPVSISIAADNNPVCSGTPVTFTATPANATSPTYAWFNGVHR